MRTIRWRLPKRFAHIVQPASGSWTRVLPILRLHSGLNRIKVPEVWLLCCLWIMWDRSGGSGFRAIVTKQSHTVLYVLMRAIRLLPMSWVSFHSFSPSSGVVHWDVSHLLVFGNPCSRVDIRYRPLMAQLITIRVVPEDLSTRTRRDLDKAHLAVFQLNLPFVILVLCYLVPIKSRLSRYPTHPHSRP